MHLLFSIVCHPDNLNQLNYGNSNKNKLKQLLIQLVITISEEELEQEDKLDCLEQIQNLADTLQDNQNRKQKRKAKASMGIIQDIVDDLPQTSVMVSLCHKLSDAITQIF